jgi:hypothetical protein
MCLTMPMGFSHAVYLAQSCHQHVLYSAHALQPCDDILGLASPVVTSTRTLHGIVIDDFFLFCLDLDLARETMQRVLSAYAAAGFVVKDSKVVWPTSAPIKVIGFDICGRDASIRLPMDSLHSLIGVTKAVLQASTISGNQLAHVVGRWTWVMMLRRSTLSVLQQCYRFCREAQQSQFNVWPSVRRELAMLLTLLPLMEADLSKPFFHRAMASDASTLAAGVVSAPLSSDMHARMWPLCSSRMHATLQVQVNREVKDAMQGWDGNGSPPHVYLPPSLTDTSSLDRFQSFYSDVQSTRWRTIVSKAWAGDEHINALELRAALLAAHWALSYPSALTSRVYLLLDSTVAFFALWKGRSSSPKLLLVLRKLTALLLAGGLSLLPGWVPSEVMPADAASRLLPPAPPPPQQ